MRAGAVLCLVAMVGCESIGTPATVSWHGHVLHEVRSLAALPPGIRSELGVDLPGTEGVADRGRPFSVTDVVSHGAPFRRLLTAGRDGDTWLVALERGGRAYNVKVFLFDPDSTSKHSWILFTRPKTLKQVVQGISRSGPS